MNLRKIFLLLFMTVALTGCATPKIQIKSGDLEMELNRKVPTVHTVDFSRDGKNVISGGWDDTARLWDAMAGKKIKEFKGHGSIIVDLSFSPDGQSFASASFDDTIRIWDIASGQDARKISDLGGTPHAVDYSPDGKYVVGYIHPQFSFSLFTKFYNARTGDLEKTITGFVDGMPPSKKRGHISPDGKAIVIKENENNIVLKDLSMDKELWRANHGNAKVLSFTPSGKTILAVCSTGSTENLLLLDAATGNLIKNLYRTGSLYGFSQSVYDMIRAIAVSPDGKFAISGDVGGHYKLWDLSIGVMVRQFKTVDEIGGTLLDVLPSVAFSPDSRTAVIASIASTRLFDVSTGEEIATMLAFEDGEWLVTTPEGYYNASEKGAQYLTVKYEGQDYTVDQFYDVFYRPDIVAAKLAGQDISGLISITMKDARKSPPPQIEFTSHTAGGDQQKAKVCYRVKNSGGGIGEVRVFHNGKLIQSDGYYREVTKAPGDKTQLAALSSKTIYEDMRSITLKGTADNIPISAKPRGDLLQECREIEAIPGENEVSIAAFNGSNTVQSNVKTIGFNSNTKTDAPHLYILSVGIDQYQESSVNLRYAVKDAKDLEEKLKTQSATLYKPKNIHYLLLTDREATKTNIITKVNELSNTIKPQDSFILFVAGHGVLLQNQYYLLTHDYNGMVNDNSMISSNEIVEMSKKIKSLSQLFIFDTCHAGGVDTIVSGLYDARMSVLAKKMGLHIYASASDKQAALDGYKGNGLFTYALLDGLNNNKEADKNKDGKVSVVGLGDYSKKKTTNISKEIGHSQTPLIINFGRDNPIYQLK